MPRISDIEILHLPEQPVLSIETRTTPDVLPDVIGKGYARLAAYLQKIDGRSSDVPFVAYCQNLSAEALPIVENCAMNLDIELCLPLPAPLPGEGDIIFRTLPAREVAFCMILGPYDAVDPVYEEMADWIQKKGYRAPQVSYEYYYNGQRYPDAHLLTKLMMLLEQ